MNGRTSLLKRYPVFTIKDIAGVLGKGREYAYVAAYRMKKAGRIHEIEKGKYTMEEDPFLVASWIVWPSYISGLAALRYHKLTDQLPFTIHVVTTRKRKRKVIAYGNAKIEFIKIRKGAFFGFTRTAYEGREIFVAEKEKAVIDALATRKMSMIEAAELIKSAGRGINRKKLFSYAKCARRLDKKLKAMLND